ncbi:MAG: von Willebrand factor type A domain-containing protein [Oscillospiraceae bacterium]
MKKKFRTTALITAAVCAVSLAGCGQSESSSDSYYDGADNDMYENDSKDASYETAADMEPAVEEVAEEEGFSYDNSLGATMGSADVTYAVDTEYQYFPNSEEYEDITESGFKLTAENPLSTFSADVDTASYTNIRRMINNGYYPNSEAVRIEEIMNYFDYDYPNAKDGEPFSVTTELSACPWNEDNQLLLVGIKADESKVQTDLPMNLVFLIDVSGSMYDSDKLPLVQQAFTMLTDKLDSEDRISIVTYAGEDRVVLRGESGENKKVINNAINDLTAGGATAGAAGIATAYEIAEEYFIEGGNNRVILATDGDLNVGVSNKDGLVELIESERDSGVYLSVLGFGEGNLKDDRLEALADNGNGNYSYIDCVSEAKKVLIDEMDSTLVTVAKDVKFQVEFNPENVAGYRLIGYENRALADRDFNDDTKDAGEVGAGSTVTVLYELIPANSANTYTPEYKYSANEKPVETAAPSGEYSDELLTVNIRCKAPDSEESELYSYPVKVSLFTERMPRDLNFAACCAEFGMLLRNSENKGTASWSDLTDMLDNYDYSDDEYKTEFEYLVRAAASMSR